MVFCFVLCVQSFCVVSGCSSSREGGGDADVLQLSEEWCRRDGTSLWSWRLWWLLFAFEEQQKRKERIEELWILCLLCLYPVSFLLLFCYESLKVTMELWNRFFSLRCQVRGATAREIRSDGVHSSFNLAWFQQLQVHLCRMPTVEWQRETQKRKDLKSAIAIVLLIFRKHDDRIDSREEGRKEVER
jgi:hypothetical protein